VSALHVVALTGGISFPSSSRLLSDLLLGRTAAHLEAQGREVATRTIEVRDVAEDAATANVLGFRSRELTDALAAVEESDLLVAASPVFRGSYSGVFKTFVDLLDGRRMAGKPVLLAAAGGTVRHTLVIDQALRPLFAFMGAVIVPLGVYASTREWTVERLPTTALAERADRAAAQLARLVVLVEGAAPGTSTDADVVLGEPGSLPRG
jgi:FMN reductase